MEATHINTRPDPATRPHPVSRYLKVCRFLKHFGREYPPTSRLVLLANTEDNLSIDDLKAITGAAITPLIQNLARLAREGLVTYYESEAFRFKRSLYSINYVALDQKVRAHLCPSEPACTDPATGLLPEDVEL